MAREVPEEESYRRADKESRIQKFNKINKENMAIIGIDFDGTCVTDLFPYVGDNIGAASVLRKLADKNLLILYTVRDGKYLQDAVDWFKYNHINLYSVNYNPEPVSSSPKLISYVNFAINVRGYTDKELDTLKDELPQEMIDISSFHLFNSYGRAENDKSLPSLRINDVYDEWRCYASDGECFGRDLEKRAKHESKL